MREILCFSFSIMILTSFASESLDSILGESVINSKKQLPVLKVNNNANPSKSFDYMVNKTVTKTSNGGSGFTINSEKSFPITTQMLPQANVKNIGGGAVNIVETKSPSVMSNQFSNLDAIDKDSNDLNQLNRKLQVETVEAEIRKLKSSHVSSGGNENSANNNVQTTVTGVAINAQNKKIAWLQFADGGTLTVNIGSSVGKYKVIDIDMTGVTIGEEVGSKKHMKTIFLKRVYAMATPSKNHGNYNNKSSSYFTPSPVITGANSKSDYVPPIIPFN